MDTGELTITADRLVENVIGAFQLPLGIATNLIVDTGRLNADRFVAEGGSYSLPRIVLLALSNLITPSQAKHKEATFLLGIWI